MPSREPNHVPLVGQHLETGTPRLALVTPLDKNFISVYIHDRKTNALVDTGAGISCMSDTFFRSIPSRCRPPLNTPTYNQVTGVGGEILPTMGMASLPVQVNGEFYSQKFHIFPNLHHHLILGDDFLTTYKATINKATQELHLKGGKQIVACASISPQIGIARIPKHTTLPAATESILPLKISRSKHMHVAILEPTSTIKNKQKFMLAKSVVQVRNGVAMCRILNPTPYPISLTPGLSIAVATPIDTDLITPLDVDDGTPSVSSASTSKVQPGPAAHEITEEAAIGIANSMGIKLNNPNLSESDKREVLAFIGRNRDVFATSLSELGRTNVHTHKIDTGDAAPIRQRPYRTSPKIQAEIDRQIDEMLANNVIEESVSMWQSPVVMVKKKSGDYRFAVDFRRVNQVTKQISFPLPRLETVFDQLGQAKANWFTTLDLASGFWQVPLDSETKEKTTFVTNTGRQFNFRVLPFGLVNAPSTYQLVMNQVLQGLNWKILLCYIDDIIVFSSTLSEHLSHLNMVFQRLRAADLKIKPSKCTFAAERVLYLGHYLSKNGIEANPDKVAAVESFPRPTTIKSVRSFVGLCSYYRRFIKDFSSIAAPLNKLTRKSQKFCWSPECENAFQSLKSALISAPVLRLPDMNKQFILTTDASTTAISYILGQRDENGKEYAIHYGGRALRGAEVNYSITELECLAMVEGVRAYHPYLAHRRFEAVTDNIALTWLKNVKPTTPRLTRWALVLQEYNPIIRHRSGLKNKNADALSRREYKCSDSPRSKISESVLHEKTALSADPMASAPIPPKEPQQNYSPQSEILEAKFEYNDHQATQLTPTVSVLSPPTLIEAQKECSDFSDIYKYLDNDELPTTRAQAKRILAEADQYIIDEGVLYHIYTPRTKGAPKASRTIRQLAVPLEWRQDVLLSYHDSLMGGGHQGFDRTYAAIRQKYYWPRMYSTIFDYIKRCDDCQKSKRHHHAQHAPLKPMPIEGRFDRWHMDILGPLMTKNKDGYKYVLLIVDSYTRWPEAFPTKTQEASEIASILYREIFTRYGAPRSLISDRGQNFMSKLVTSICDLFEVTRHHTSSYHPQTNATCERYNQTLAQAIRAHCLDVSNWPNMLPGILMAYRMTPATQSTQLSPYFMVFGREMLLPFDTSLKPANTLPIKARSHMQAILENLELAETIAEENIKKSQESSKTYYDKKSKNPNFSLGDRVLLYVPKIPTGVSKKLHRKEEGPYYITATGPGYTYKLRDCSTNKQMKSLVHANRLKPYYDPSDRILQPMTQAQNPPTVADHSNAATSTDSQQTQHPRVDEWRQVERLLATKMISGVRYYRVKWTDNTPSSWEPVQNISQPLLHAYHITHTKTGKRRRRKTLIQANP